MSQCYFIARETYDWLLTLKIEVVLIIVILSWGERLRLVGWSIGNQTGGSLPEMVYGSRWRVEERIQKHLQLGRASEIVWPLIYLWNSHTDISTPWYGSFAWRAVCFLYSAAFLLQALGCSSCPEHIRLRNVVLYKMSVWTFIKLELAPAYAISLRGGTVLCRTHLTSVPKLTERFVIVDMLKRRCGSGHDFYCIYTFFPTSKPFNYMTMSNNKCPSIGV